MKVVGTGLACLDIINSEHEIVTMNGGTCANVLTALSQLREDALLLIPRYANDLQNERFYTTFEHLNVKLLFYGSTKLNIPRIIEEYDENFKHYFYTKCPRCNKELIKTRLISNSEAVKLIEKVRDCDVFFTDRVSDGIKTLAHELDCKGTKIFYEPNSGRNIKALIEMASISHVLKFSTDRISMSLANAILNECKDSALQLVIATHGKEGLSFCYKRGSDAFSEWIKGPHVDFDNVKDTSGAGDWLTAGFIHYWNEENWSLNSEQIYNALERALKLSAIASMSEGAQGIFYDNNIFNIFKKQFDIKLESVLAPNIEKDNEHKYCDTCLLEVFD